LTLADNAATILTVFGIPNDRWGLAMAGTVEAGELLQLDALDFCWIAAARQPGTGLMATKVPF
jgi:hypothetical protein